MAVGAPPKFLDPDAPNDPAVEATFQAVPSDQVAQILDGELFTMTRPGRAHTHAASVLGGELHGPFRRGAGGPGGWIILYEPDLHLGPRPDKVVPDFAGWREERMTAGVAASDALAHYDIVPDWVCEIVSPGTEAIDRGKKMPIYRREAVGHMWLINPVARTLEVYCLDSGHWLLLETFESEEVVRAEPFDAIDLSLALLWGG